MSSETMPKEFESSTEVLPFTKKGLSTVQEFKNIEDQIRTIEKLKKAGLSDEEIKLYQDNEAGNLIQHNKIEHSIMKLKLDAIYKKINASDNNREEKEEAGTSETNEILPKLQQSNVPIYPKGHPMNEIKDLEQQMFSHHKTEPMPSITKRRKMLRRLERKKQRLANKEHVFLKPTSTVSQHRRNTKWDVQTPQEVQDNIQSAENKTNKTLFGPQKPNMYTLKDNQIVKIDSNNAKLQNAGRLETVPLEGTKMSVDDIKKNPEFKDYEPGMPSKVLLLKNIDPSASEEQVSLLFKQFEFDNGEPIAVQLTESNSKHIAFVTFKDEDIAIQALEETNGTIICGRPVVAYFKQEHENT